MMYSIVFPDEIPLTLETEEPISVGEEIRLVHGFAEETQHLKARKFRVVKVIRCIHGRANGSLARNETPSVYLEEISK